MEMEKDEHEVETSTSQTLKVEIYNQTYNIRGDGNNDYVERLATFVDEKMREIASSTLTVDSLRVAILAALNIADELHQLRNRQEEFDAVLGQRSSQCAILLDQVLKKGTDFSKDDTDF